MEEIPERTPRRSKVAAAQMRKLMWAGALMLGLVFLVAAAPWLSERWKAAQARALTAEAARLTAEGNLEMAVPLLMKAWQRYPDDPAVLRELARVCDELPGRGSDAVTFWQKVVSGADATADDQVSLAAALVRSGDDKAARNVFLSLDPGKRRGPKAAEVEAALLRCDGREEEAQALLLAAWRADQGSSLSRLKLAQVEMSSSLEPVRAAALGRLWALAREKDAVAVQALMALSAVPAPPQQAGEILRLLAECPKVTDRDRLRILAGCVRLNPALAPDLVAEESRRHQGRSPESAPEFYEWLVRLRAFDRVIADLSAVSQAPVSLGSISSTGQRAPLPAVMKSRDLFLAYGDALIGSGNWGEFTRLLGLPDPPVGRADLALMHAMAARGQGQSIRDVDEPLSLALNLARNARAMAELRRVADLAEQFGRESIALEALETLSLDRRTRLEMLERMYRIQSGNFDAEGRLRSAAAILEIRPGLEPYAADATYLRLLTGRDLEAALRSLDEAGSIDASANPLRRLTAALAFYVRGDSDRMRGLLLSLSPGSLPAGPRAVLAGLLSESGRLPEALRIVEKIPSAVLVPDEFWFYRMALR